MLSIYTVQPGDTILSIADKYNIPYQKLLEDNSLSSNFGLVKGQSIIIVSPDQTYIVKEGDTLDSIASANGITKKQLLKNNPQIIGRAYFYVGEELTINYQTKRELEVIGYTGTFISQELLIKSLPNLTYISILNYSSNALGELNNINDEPIIHLARLYEVQPLMFVSSLSSTGKGSYGITHSILSKEEVQKKLIDNIIIKMKDKGYYGLNLSFINILPIDLNSYVKFIELATLRLNRLGYPVFVSLPPDTFTYKPGVPYDFTNIKLIGKAANYVILITYLWANATISQVSQTAVDYLSAYTEDIITQIPPEKVFLGVNRIAYDWELPYVENDSINISITNYAALNLANQFGSNIKFDEVKQTPYLFYYNNGINHYVWFKDARSFDALLKLVEKYNLRGIAVWNITYYYSLLWLTINSQYNVITVTSTTKEKEQEG